MKIKYTGHAEKMSILLPIGSSRAGAKSALHVNRGEVIELSDEEGQKLLDLNKKNKNWAAAEKVKEEKAEGLKLDQPVPAVAKHVEEKPKAKADHDEEHHAKKKHK